MALGRLIGDLFEGSGPFFRNIFEGIGSVLSSIGEFVLDLFPDVVFQILVNQFGIGPVLVGLLAIVLVLIVFGLAARRKTRKSGKKQLRENQR